MATSSDTRNANRSTVSINALIKVRESNDRLRKETADVINVSKNGASLYLAEGCKIGCLISMLIPLAEELRLYDRDKEFYRVYGIVQYCSPVREADDLRYQIGIAFIGKFAPASYKQNPQQSYRISGMNEAGLWNIVEAKNDFVSRQFPRYWISLEVSLQITETEAEDKAAVTENVSLKGAALQTTLKPEVGEYVRLDYEEGDFSAPAIVRNIRKLNEKLNRLHVEFTEQDFPLQKISLPFFEDEETSPAGNKQEN